MALIFFCSYKKCKTLISSHIWPFVNLTFDWHWYESFWVCGWGHKEGFVCIMIKIWLNDLCNVPCDKRRHISLVFPCEHPTPSTINPKTPTNMLTSCLYYLISIPNSLHFSSLFPFCWKWSTMCSHIENHFFGYWRLHTRNKNFNKTLILLNFFVKRKILPLLLPLAWDVVISLRNYHCGFCSLMRWMGCTWSLEHASPITRMGGKCYYSPTRPFVIQKPWWGGNINHIILLM
jgi:hypothetical protein